jgi:two-component system nitrate/nitrite response regulator NarL
MTATRPSAGARPRVAVVGQFRLVVEAVGRSLAPSARVLPPVPLEAYLSMNAARDTVLRAKPDLVAIVVAAHDTIDVHDLVAELDARSHRVIVVGQVGGAVASAELLAAGAAAVLEDDGIIGLVGLIEQHTAVGRDRRSPRPRTRRPAPAVALSAERRNRRNLGRLTAAEARILWRLMHGSSVAEIAQAHVVSVATVRSQIRALLTKLEAGSQLAAVALAWQVAWAPAPAALQAA